MSHVPPRLKELNFEVKVFQDPKQAEVVEIITNGELPPGQTVMRVIRPIQSLLTNILSPQLPRMTIQTSTAF